MCLIFFAWQSHPRYSLVFAGNRDEAHDRPAAPAAYWNEDPHIFGGRDLGKGGSWLALARSGRYAAVTNYRQRPRPGPAPASRGELVSRYVRGMETPAHYVAAAYRDGARYGAYSLIAGDGGSLWYCSNRDPGPARAVAPGVHGLSNHLLDTPWPKVVRGTARLAALLAAGEPELVQGLFELLADRTPAPDAGLPDTGVGPARERELSAAFIAAPDYGTRASTVLLVDRSGTALFIERSFGPHGTPLGVVEQRIALVAAPAPLGAGR